MSDEPPSIWKKAQTVSTIIASVLIPIVIAFIGHIVNQSIKNNELSLSYIELAVGILKDEPKPGTENLRAWAIDVVNNYSSVKLTTDAKKELRERPLPLIGSIDHNPLSERADFLRRNKSKQISKGAEGSYQIEQHILLDASGEPVSVVETQNTSGKLEEHKFVVLHFTGGTSSEATLMWIADAQAKASMHLLIDRNGEITQLVPFDYIAWHAGRSKWNGLLGLNKYSIGVSFSNAGPLTKKNGEWITLSGKNIPESDVYIERDASTGEERGWHKYTQAQIDTALKVIPVIIKSYPTIEEVLRHSDITEGRRLEPGPAFPMEAFRKLVSKSAKK